MSLQEANSRLRILRVRIVFIRRAISGMKGIVDENQAAANLS